MYDINLHTENEIVLKRKDVWSFIVGFEKFNNQTFSKLGFVSDIY